MRRSRSSEDELSKFDNLVAVLIDRLYERANMPQSPTDFSGREIIDLLADLTGPPIAQQVLTSLLEQRLLRQTRTISDANRGHYQLTRAFMERAESPAHVEADANERLSSPDTQSYSRFKDNLLVALADAEQEHGPQFFDLQKLAVENHLAFNPGWIRKAGTTFRDLGYIIDSFTMAEGEDGGIAAQLTGDGLEEAEELRAQFVQVEPTDNTELAPASDRTVPLDHNSPAYGEVVEKLEELKRVIESNNEYRETDLEDHERRLTDVESTLKLLENKRVNVNAMKAVAFGTLAYLVEKFAEHPIGDLAKAAWDGLKTLLGIS